MFGLLITAIVALINFLGHKSLEVIYLNSTHFLSHWYVITSIILGVLLLLVTLGLVGVGAAAGKFIGFMVGAAGSVLIWIFFLVKRALLIIGSSLLYQALTMSNGVANWSTTKLAVGVLLMLIAVALRGGGSSSRTSSRS